MNESMIENSLFSYVFISEDLQHNEANLSINDMQ